MEYDVDLDKCTKFSNSDLEQYSWNTNHFAQTSSRDLKHVGSNNCISYSSHQTEIASSHNPNSGNVTLISSINTRSHIKMLPLMNSSLHNQTYHPTEHIKTL